MDRYPVVLHTLQGEQVSPVVERVCATAAQQLMHLHASFVFAHSKRLAECRCCERCDKLVPCAAMRTCLFCLVMRSVLLDSLALLLCMAGRWLGADMPRSKINTGVGNCIRGGCQHQRGSAVGSPLHCALTAWLFSKLVTIALNTLWGSSIGRSGCIKSCSVHGCVDRACFSRTHVHTVGLVFWGDYQGWSLTCVLFQPRASIML